jgi:hypothetical protein
MAVFISFVFSHLQGIIYTGREDPSSCRIMDLRKVAPAPVHPSDGMSAPQKFSDSTTNQ